MRRAEINRAVLEIDDDPVQRLRHDPHGLDAWDGGDGPEGRAALAPHFFEAVELWRRCRCQAKYSGGTPWQSLEHDPEKWEPVFGQDQAPKNAGHAGTRPPKNGISAWLRACGRPDVKIISAPAPSKTSPGVPIRSITRRAIAGAGSIQSTGQGASRARRSSSSG